MPIALEVSSGNGKSLTATLSTLLFVREVFFDIGKCPDASGMASIYLSTTSFLVTGFHVL